MHAPRSDEELLSGINVTPMVDVALVLLVVFLVTARLISNPNAIQIQLPQASTGGETQSVLSVALDAQGTTFVDQRPISGDVELTERVRASLSKDKDARAVLHADGAVPHARVVHAMDVLRKSGMTRIAFAVEKAAQP